MIGGYIFLTIILLDVIHDVHVRHMTLEGYAHGIHRVPHDIWSPRDMLSTTYPRHMLPTTYVTRGISHVSTAYTVFPQYNTDTQWICSPRYTSPQYIPHSARYILRYPRHLLHACYPRDIVVYPVGTCSPRDNIYRGEHPPCCPRYILFVTHGIHPRYI